MITIKVRTLVLAGAIFFVFQSALLAFMFVSFTDQVDTAEGDTAKVADALETEQDAAIARGDEPVTPPVEEIIELPPGAIGERGPGPTAEQVREAVVLYFAANPPEPGRPPTQAEVDAAVARFCAGDRCLGPAGSAGRDGQEGIQGETGNRGPGPTDEQVANAVVVYCDAHNGCTGPQGAQGVPGPVGPSIDACDPPAGYNPIIDPDQPGWTCYTTTTAAP